MSEKKRELTKFEKNYIYATIGVVIICAIIAGWQLFGDKIFGSSEAESVEATQEEVTLGVVTMGDMSTYITESGSVSVPNTTSISLPIESVIKDIFVEEGDLIKKGDLLYTINSASLQQGLQNLETELADQLSEVDTDEDSYSTKIKATQDGRIKLLVAETGKEVLDIMADNEQMALLSTAGTMFVEIETDAVAVGDVVSVSIDGESVEGSVISLSKSNATIEIDSDKYNVYQEVSVLSIEGTSLGSGVLELTEYISIQSVNGEILAVYVSENDEVEQGDYLLKVSVTDKTNAEAYETINDLYEQIAVLNAYSNNGGVVAPYDGIVGTISASEGLNAQAGESVLEIQPSSGFEITVTVDEEDLGDIYVGQTAEIVFSTGAVLDGEVVHIDHNAVSSGSSATFSVYVSLYECEEIDNNEVLPGMTGEVTILLTENTDAVRVPLEGVFEDNTGYYVLIFTGDEDISQYETYDIPQEIQYVEIGEISELYVQVTSGLSGGEQVVMVNTSNIDTEQFGNMMGGGIGGWDRGEMENPPQFSGRDMPSARGN